MTSEILDFLKDHHPHSSIDGLKIIKRYEDTAYDVYVTLVQYNNVIQDSAFINFVCLVKTPQSFERISTFDLKDALGMFRKTVTNFM